MDRRRFLCAASAAGTMLAMPSRAATGQPPRPRGHSSLYVDAQGALDGFDADANGKLTPSKRLIDAIRERRIDLMSITVGDVGNGAGADRFRNATESIASYDKLIADNATLLTKVETVSDLRSARAGGKLGLIYNFQDTVALESDSGRVQSFASLGIKVMQLTYNKRNLSGDGCLERANAGLSDFGREVIGKINEAKVLLDLSHAGQRTAAEGIAASKAPVAITHSGCRALADLPRNTYDTEMRALADKGGVFGVYLMPFLRVKGQPGAEDLLRHIEHAVNVCGEDHVGIGTDNPLLGYEVNNETRKRQRESYEERAKRGIAAPGEQPDVLLLVEGYNGASRYDSIGADLRRRGWSSARIEKILGRNFARLFGEVWKG
jgi:membrane dipeptidase